MRVVLQIEDGPDAGRKTWVTASAVLCVGRSELSDFALPHDGHLSSSHFAVEVSSEACRIRDLNSSNGTFVDGQRVTQAILEDGARIRAGQTTFAVSIERKTASVKPWPLPVAPPGPERLATVPKPSAVATAVLEKPAAPSEAERSAAHQPDKPKREAQKIVLPGQTPEGQHILSVLVKRTYDIVPGKPCPRAEKDQKLIPGDVHHDDPMNTSVKFESDFVPFKLATDVVVNGFAYAPGGKPTPSLTASVSVGPNQKDVHVMGDRMAIYKKRGGPEFTEPKRFEKMELRYERAYGGVDIYSDPKVPCLYARNPLGRGFVVAYTEKTVDNLALPNIEDPSDRLTPDRLCVEKFWEWERQPTPQGFGWFCKYWQPRAGLAGVMPADKLTEQELRAMYAPAVPEDQREQYLQNSLPDMDFRFFNGASPGLAVPFLSGGEPVRLTNLSLADPVLQFRLPGERPQIGLDLGEGVCDPEVVLQTVMIRVEDKQLDLVWRAAVPYSGPDSLPDLKKMEVHVV